MLIKNVGIGICVLCLLSACSAAPPARHIVSHDPSLDRQEGVLLLVDVCIQKDAIGDDEDFFVIAESKYAAQAIIKTIRTYVEGSNIPIRAEILAVCAAKHGSAKHILVGDNFNAEPHSATQPLYIENVLGSDEQYVKAISIISTYAFERAAIDSSDNKALENSNVNKVAFLESADIVKNRTSTSSILFLGALGTSRSVTKTVTQGIGSFVVGLGTGIATVGLGTGYYVMFSPQYSGSGSILEGALIDLESGELTWSNAVRPYGDPIEVETWLEPYSFDLLFHELLFKRAENKL
ncbi:MAG: hypothetical protein V7752_12310 [Halopseudomonas sp.]